MRWIASRWFVISLGLAVITAMLGHELHGALLTFIGAACALALLSKLLGDATEQLSRYVGEGLAGLLNVSFSNLAELIIIFVAVRAGYVPLVQAGIVGSIMGNVLLVMGLASYFGCRKHGTLKFDPQTGTLFINMLFLVGATLMIPTLFHEHIPTESQLPVSIILAAMLVGAYCYYYWLSLRHPQLKDISEQAEKLDHRWSLRRSIVVLIGAGVAAFFMSELLIGDIQEVARNLGLSEMFLGFILLPLLGNIAEHSVAVFAARKGMTELSISIAVGSASQVGMIVAPCAVLFGLITSHPLTLQFADLPLGALIVSLIAAFLVLRDNRWVLTEAIMLLALYAALVTAFFFTR